MIGGTTARAIEARESDTRGVPRKKLRRKEERESVAAPMRRFEGSMAGKLEEGNLRDASGLWLLL